MLHHDWRQRPNAQDILTQIQDWDQYENDYEKAEDFFGFVDDFKGIDIRTKNFVDGNKEMEGV